MKRNVRWAVCCALGVMLAAPVAEASYPVIDVAAIQQLVAQVNYWRQQISAMSNQLAQLRQTHAALTGTRGMQALLPQGAAARNYLPEDWRAMAEAASGQSRRYGQLASVSRSLEASVAVLPDAVLGRLGAEARASVIEARQRAAGQAAAAQLAYAQASARFASLAELITASGRAADAKAIEALQGRIAAEQAMLANEQVKLTLLAEAAAADRQLAEQRTRELAIAGHGEFASRLHPRP